MLGKEAPNPSASRRCSASFPNRVVHVKRANRGGDPGGLAQPGLLLVPDIAVQSGPGRDRTSPLSIPSEQLSTPSEQLSTRFGHLGHHVEATADHLHPATVYGISAKRGLEVPCPSCAVPVHAFRHCGHERLLGVAASVVRTWRLVVLTRDVMEKKCLSNIPPDQGE
jgi:hypothetical protein